MNKKIAIIGSCNTDMVINLERIPQPGETIIGGKFFMNSGGKGANQAVAAARLGGDVSFIAKVGKDSLGSRASKLYEIEGINVNNIFIDEDYPSGVALIMVDSQGENCIAVASGANEKLRPDDIDSAKNTIESCDIILMQLETPLKTIEYAANLGKEKGKKVILNPAPAHPLPESLLKNLYMLIANETEAELISGIKINDMNSVAHAADIISSKGVENVVITLGSKGAFIKEKNTYHQIPAHSVKAIDTTAAGDTFCGAICVALSEGKSIIESVEFANRCASITVTRMGAQSSLPYRKEI